MDFPRIFPWTKQSVVASATDIRLGGRERRRAAVASHKAHIPELIVPDIGEHWCDMSSDYVMSGKGFNVQDIFIPYDVTLNILTFFAERNRMSSKRLLDDLNIAAKGVYVEGFIDLLKYTRFYTCLLNTDASACLYRHEKSPVWIQSSDE